jgi:hypothetical protein
MSDTEERSVRDRLAEALWASRLRVWGREPAWPWQTLGEVRPGDREYWLSTADQFLAALPTVGLKIGTVDNG